VNNDYGNAMAGDFEREEQKHEFVEFRKTYVRDQTGHQLNTFYSFF